jgi:hypothetical protein
MMVAATASTRGRVKWTVGACALALLSFVAACGGGQGSSSASVSTLAPGTTLSPTTTLTPPAAGVRLSFSPSAQTELVSPEGIHVLIDVGDASALVEPFDQGDILLETHDDPDHYDAGAVKNFAGSEIIRRVDSLEMADVKVASVATVHNEGGLSGTDFIFVIDVGDLRIVHFGDIGVAALTPEQLAKVGTIDVAITQFDNSYSDVDTKNQKGFQLVEQLHPRLVIPTHQTDQSVLLMTRWPCLYTDQRSVTFTDAQLPATTSVLFIGPFAPGQGKLTGAQLVDW